MQSYMQTDMQTHEHKNTQMPTNTIYVPTGRRTTDKRTMQKTHALTPSASLPSTRKYPATAHKKGGHTYNAVLVLV